MSVSDPADGRVTMGEFTDRNGRPLKVGQRIRVQHCIGRYGQTEIVSGVITHIVTYCGATLDGNRYVTIPHNGYSKHNDFEHGHEKWAEIIEEAK